MKAWEIFLAKLNHGLLYLLMLLMPLSGLLGSMFSKYPIQFFGTPLPKLFEQNDGLKELFKEVHETCAVIMIGLIALHIAAVIKHIVIDKNQIHRRMLPKSFIE